MWNKIFYAWSSGPIIVEGKVPDVNSNDAEVGHNNFSRGYHFFINFGAPRAHLFNTWKLCRCLGRLQDANRRQ